MDETTPLPRYDVVVVGGSAAGLSGAMALGRARRTVLVLDAGEPRNAPAHGVHGYLGREGTAPGDLLSAGRAEVAQYGVQVQQARVVDARPWDRPGTGFVVTTEDGREVRGRRLLVATGLVDELPDLPGVREHWGSGVLHCPYCHGWEVRDRALVVVATSALATHQALLWRRLSDRVVLVVDERLAPAPDDGDRERLHATGVRVVEAPVAAVEGEPGALRGLRLEDGRLLEADAVVVAGRMQARSALLEGLGVAAEEVRRGEVLFGTRVPTGPTGATSVPGVWAAGNVADPAAQVVVAAGAGLVAGAAINADLVEEDTAAAVEAARAPWSEQPWWDQRYAGSGSVWSGHVNVQLAAEAADLPPARALDVGAGEGGDALWLARRGWEVTAFDFSPVALARAAGRAATEGLADRTTWRQLDVRGWEPVEERWDLVTSHFLHLPDGGMSDVVRRLAAAVAPGGTLLVVGHHPDDLATGLRQGRREWLATPEDLLPALDPDEWDVELAVRPRTEGGHGHEHGGPGVTVQDSVLRARRRR